VSWVPPEQLRAFAAVLEKAADRIEIGEPRWTSSGAFGNYHGRRAISYSGESPCGGYAPLASITYRETGARDCEGCIMGVCVAVCVLDLTFPSPWDAGAFLDDLERWLSSRLPRQWGDGIFAWNDKNDHLTPERVVHFLRAQAADAHALSTRT